MRTVFNFLKKLYIRNLFFFVLLGLMALFVFAFFFPFLYRAALYLLAWAIGFLLIDIMAVFSVRKGIDASRRAPEKLSNGDENAILISVKSYYTFPVSVSIIDEIPFQFQVRDFRINKKLAASSASELTYFLRPVERGEYSFGYLNVYVSSPLGLVSKRYKFDGAMMVPVYP